MISNINDTDIHEFGAKHESGDLVNTFVDKHRMS